MIWLTRVSWSESLKVVAVALSVLFAVFAVGCDSSESSSSSTEKENAPVVNVLESGREVESKCVNAFINAYNNVSDDKLSNLSQSAKQYMYHGRSYGHSFTMKDLSASQESGTVEVSYEISNKYEESEIDGMFEPFKYAVLAFDSSVPDDDIKVTFESIKAGNTSGVPLGNVVVKFSRGISYQGPWFSVSGKMAV